MDLATIIIIAATIFGGLLFVIDKYIHQRTFAGRAHLLSKFNEIRIKNLKLQEEIMALMSAYNASGKALFADKDPNFEEYLELLQEKLSIEFSDVEYSKLEKIALSKEIISDYMEKFRYQQDVIISLRQDINFYKNRLDATPPGTLDFGV